MIPLTTIGATEQADPAAEPSPKADTQPTLPPEKLEALKRLVGHREELDPEHRALVESMAQQYKIPMAPKTGFVEKANAVKEGVQAVGSAVKQSALPTAGQVAGMTAGQVISPGNAPLSLAMGSAGGVAGTYLNKKLGITNPDSLDYLASAMAVPGGVLATRAGRSAIPGASAAEQQIASGMMRKVPALATGSKAETDAAYKAMRDLGPTKIPAKNFHRMVNSLLTNEKNLAKYGEDVSDVRGRLLKTAGELSKNSSWMSFDDMSNLLKRYRERVASAESKGGEQYGLYKALRASMFEDMKQAIDVKGKSTPQIKALRAANDASMRRIAQEELSDIVERHGTKFISEGGQIFEVTNAAKVVNELQKIDFAKGAGPIEAAKVNAALKKIANIPHPREGLRASLGSEGRVIATGTAATAGAFAGGPLGAAGGAAAAYVGFKVHDAIASLLMSDQGRNFLVKMFTHNGGTVGAKTAAVIQFAASQFQPPGSPQPPTEGPQDQP